MTHSFPTRRSSDLPTISPLTAYRYNVVDIAADLGGLQAPFQFLAEDYIDDRSHQFSQELRFSSPDSSAVKWVGGLFYYEDRVNRTERFNVVVSAPFPVGLGGDNTGIQRARSTSYALFGQFTLPFARSEEHTSELQ